MTNFNRSNSNFDVDEMNEDESFDGERISGSFQYEDELDRTAPTADFETPQKSKKKAEEEEKRQVRQREKLEKEARKQQEKERKKSASRTRTENANEQRIVNKSVAKIIKLDQTEEDFELKKDDLGKTLFTRVANRMQIEEKDYFGLKYYNSEQILCWLDNDKRVRSQLKGVDPIFYFQVKFYPPEPALLQEDLTRYQLCLQIRNDITSGKLPCSFITYALLGSYTAQAEIGDYDEQDHGIGLNYLKQLQFAPVQDDELLRRIHEQHKRHRGQPPSAADLHFLENAKKLAMYGVDIHPAQDSENVDINIGVSANGLLIYRDKLRINRFAWPKILKISYKRKYFFIKLRPSEFDRYESTIGFKLSSYRAAKSLWKIAVEHHAFFRLRRPEEIRKKAILPRFNSTFRYTGNFTYHQARQMLLDRPNPEFERALSKRMTKSMDVSTSETNRSNNQRPMARPQSVEPFFEIHRMPLPNRDDENYRGGILKDPEYAHVTRKPQRDPNQHVPATPPRTPRPTEIKPRRPPSTNPTYVNVPTTTPPPRPPPPRQPSPAMDPDEALLAAIRLATDLDPNKEAEQVVLPNN